MYYVLCIMYVCVYVLCIPGDKEQTRRIMYVLCIMYVCMYYVFQVTKNKHGNKHVIPFSYFLILRKKLRNLLLKSQKGGVIF